MTCSYILRLDVLNRGCSGATIDDYVRDAKRIVDSVGNYDYADTVVARFLMDELHYSEAGNWLHCEGSSGKSIPASDCFR